MSDSRRTPEPSGDQTPKSKDPRKNTPWYVGHNGIREHHKKESKIIDNDGMWPDLSERYMITTPFQWARSPVTKFPRAKHPKNSITFEAIKRGYRNRAILVRYTGEILEVDPYSYQLFEHQIPPGIYEYIELRYMIPAGVADKFIEYGTYGVTSRDGQMQSSRHNYDMVHEALSGLDPEIYPKVYAYCTEILDPDFRDDKIVKVDKPLNFSSGDPNSYKSAV